jgi:phosphohistidine phosphatase
MKTVHLIRHAKSSRDDPSLRDIDRALAARGRRDAPVMGTRMRKAGLTFDVLYSSPAVRALETARLLVEGMDESAELITVVHELYDADEYGLLDYLKQQPAALDSIGLVLHNPAVTSLANAIGDLELENIPTCAIYSVVSKTDRWSEIGEGWGHTIRFDRPPKNKKKKWPGD